MNEVPDSEFDIGIQNYIDLYLAQHEIPQAKLTDVHEHRGLFVNLSRLYYERSQRMKSRNNDLYRHRRHLAVEYLRTVHDDLRVLGEPHNQHLDRLMIEFGAKIPGFPDPFSNETIKKFHANVMKVLPKIDPNISKLS